MNRRHSLSANCCSRERCCGFTLIELLVVVAIIALLIGILIPSLGAARDAAKRVKTQATMKGIGDCLEVFSKENTTELRGAAYPSSAAGDDPTENDGSIEMFGAQHLVRYLLGKRLNGYISPSNVPKTYPPWNNQQGYEQKGWYEDPNDPAAPAGLTEPLPRTCYMAPDGAKVKAPKDLQGWIGDDTLAKSKNLVFVDVYEMPIVYYSADPRQADKPGAAIANSHRRFTGLTDTAYDAIYCFGDNALFTGGCACGGNPPVCEICRIVQCFGDVGPVEWFPSAWVDAPPAAGWNDPATGIPHYPNSFPYYIMNKDVWETTSHKSTVPYRKDSFLLISPGKDAKFGTRDDVTNFQ